MTKNSSAQTVPRATSQRSQAHYGEDKQCAISSAAAPSTGGLISSSTAICPFKLPQSPIIERKQPNNDKNEIIASKQTSA